MMVGAVILGFQPMSWLLTSIPPEMDEQTKKDPRSCQRPVLQEVRQQARKVRQVPGVRDKVPLERCHKEVGRGGGFAATIALITIATSLLKHYHVDFENGITRGSSSKAKPKAKGYPAAPASTMTSSSGTNEERERILNSILQMAAHDVSQNMTPEEIAEVHRDLEVNRDYYRQEHAADIDRVLATSMRSKTFELEQQENKCPMERSTTGNKSKTPRNFEEQCQQPGVGGEDL